MNEGYKRILLKLSGEALGNSENTFNKDGLLSIVREVESIVTGGIEVAVVIGGGNIFRGASASELGINRVTRDHMGMLATMINALALKETFLSCGIKSCALGAVGIPGIMESYSPGLARERMEKKEVLILGGGSGNPFFTTDTAAVLRASELFVDALVKATKVDYVYDRDPMGDPGARPFKRLSYKQVLEKGLRVMDLTAITMAMELKIPIKVINFQVKGNLKAAVEGADIGTLIWEVAE